MSKIYLNGVKAETEIPEIIAAIKRLRQKSPERNILVLVPESMTLEYEQAILQNRKGMLNVSVKSVKKLQKTVIQTYGYDDRYKDKETVLVSKAGSIAKIYLLLIDRMKEFRYFKTPRISSAEKMYDIYRELMDSKYDKTDLLKYMQLPTIPPTLYNLLNDIVILYEVLENDRDENLLDEALQWKYFCDQTRKHKVFQNTEVIFCGYDVIYARMRELLYSICESDPEITIHYFMIYPVFNNQIYDSLKESIEILIALAKKRESMPINIIESYEETHTDAIEYDPAIRYLAARVINHIVQKPENYKNIEVYNAPNQYIECLHAVQKVIEWHDEGINWKEIGIVSDMDQDAICEMLPRIMESAGVPYFMANAEPAMVCAPCYYIEKIIEAFPVYTTQALIDIMKSGFANITADEAKILENYAISHGIQGAKWLKPFPNPAKDKTIDVLNDIRDRLISPIRMLQQELTDRKKDIRSQAESLWAFLIQTDFYKKLQDKEKEYQDLGYTHYADHVRQSWHIICKTLNMLATEANNKKHVSMTALKEIFAKSLELEKLKSIPQTADAVLIDCPRVFVGGQRKCCVYMGMQGKIIKPANSLLTAEFRQWMIVNEDALDSRDHFLNENREMNQAETRRWLQSVYRGFMSATEKLCVSASALSHSGQPIQTNDIFENVNDIIRENNPENVKGGIIINDLRPYAHDETVEMLSQKLRELMLYNTGDLSDNPISNDAVLWKKAYAYLYENEPETIKKMLQAVNISTGTESIPADTANELFRNDITSISELEGFAACPFSHFIKYGLRPVEQKRFAYEADQKGIFFHAAMKAYIERAKKDPAFPAISRRDIVTYFNEAIKPLLKEFEETPLTENILSRMEMNEYIETARNAAIYVTLWLDKTHYMAEKCEVSFGKADSTMPPLVLETGKGHRMALAGTIDRYDTFTDPETGKTYGRVIDYKSSDKVLDKAAVEQGYQLQLPIYLSALLKANPGMSPAGAMYQHITNPKIEADETESEEEIVKKILSKTRMEGMYLKTDDKNFNDASGGSVNASERTLKNLTGLTESELQDVLKNSRKKAIEHADRILDGDIAISPVTIAGESPCKYCKSKGICLFTTHQTNGGD